MSSHKCIEKLRKARPEVAIRVSRYVDDYARWDEKERGEPQPENCVPFFFEVRAYAIHNGVLYRGMDTLSDSWWEPGDPIGDIGGYLPQMVDEAVAELDNALAAARK